ncbi:MAG: hypothetical protein IH934_07300 [Nanoarchaeota archaeon]|nr:hypothetical protein [Nanoarchaeota archaeon]
MESTLEFLTSKHATLINDYKTPDGRFNEGCGTIAKRVARRLLIEGKTPYIIEIQGRIKDIGGNRERLTPIPYSGRISWGCHLVCCADGVAYNPMLGEPLPIEQYCQRAFEEDVDIFNCVSESRIEEYIELGSHPL